MTLTLDTAWAELISALQDPEATNGPAKRAVLLTSALGLGVTVAPHALACSITQASDAGFRTPASSAPLALSLDLVQYAADEGPCVAACRDRREHHIADMAQASVHPVFVAAAQERGVLSSLSLPLGTAASRSALNLYAGAPNVFSTPRAHTSAVMLARCVARLVPDTDEAHIDAIVPPAVLEQRDTMRQAAGILRRRQLSAVESFVIMMNVSRDGGQSIFAVADEIIASVEAGA